MGKDRKPGNEAAQPATPPEGPAQPPPLPDGLPQGLRDFLECRAVTATLRDGPVAWVHIGSMAEAVFGLGAKPTVKIEQGSGPGKATVHVTLGELALKLPAIIDGGQLIVDTGDVPAGAPDSITDGINRVVDGLNGTLAANGRKLGPAVFGNGFVVLSKMPIIVAATPEAPVFAPIPPPAPANLTGGGSAISGLPYLDGKVEQPPLPAGRLFGPKPPAPDAVDGIAEPAAGFAPRTPRGTLITWSTPPADPVVGAGGPGAARARAGLGILARLAIVALIIATLGLVAFLFIAPPGDPAQVGATEGPTAPVSAPASVAPTAVATPTARR